MFYFYLIFALIFGLIIGSFINSLIFRLYKNESLLSRSYCPKCKHQIAWYDNIPILSFIILKAKCRFCQKKISWQYPVIELVTGILFALSFYLVGLESMDALVLFKSWFIVAVFIIIFVFDLKWKIIPVNLVIISGVVFIALNLILGLNWWQLLYSFLFGFGFFAGQFFLSQGKWIGEGDVWLSALLVLFFPVLDKMILLVFLTYFIGAIVSVFLIATNKKEMGEKIPLGVFISLAGLIVLFVGENIISWYLSLF